VRIGPSHVGSHGGEDVGRRRVGLDCVDLRAARYAIKEERLTQALPAVAFLN
jgi:hypothetical protein